MSVTLKQSSNVADVLNASIIAEIEAYLERNKHRDPKVVKGEVFAILDSVIKHADHLRGEFTPTHTGYTALEVAEQVVAADRAARVAGGVA